MTDLVASSIITHNIAIFALLCLILYHFVIVSKTTDFISLAKKLRFTTPIFHSINAFVVYTGAVVSAYAKIFDFTVILMVFASLFLMISEIKRYKKMRVILSNDSKQQDEFKFFAKKIYILQLIAIFAVYIISKIF
jgi:heme A synthase